MPHDVAGTITLDDENPASSTGSFTVAVASPVTFDVELDLAVEEAVAATSEGAAVAA